MQALTWLILVVAGYIVWQDFKYRCVFILSMGLIFALLMARGIIMYSFFENLKFFLINACFITFQLVCLTLYLTLKERRLVLITKNHLGTGDIVILYALCFLAEPVIFILFYLFTIAFSLIFALIYKITGIYPKGDDKKERSIPLAGIFSLTTGLYLICIDLCHYELFEWVSALSGFRIV